MPKLLKIVIGSAALIAIAAARGTERFRAREPVRRIRAATDATNAIRIWSWGPRRQLGQQVGESVALSITVPGMSKAADCALSGAGSVQWTPLAGQALPKIYIQEGEPCRSAAPGSTLRRQGRLR